MAAVVVPLQTAEILAIGTEMLAADRLDTNSLFLASRLQELGIQLRAKSVVGDERPLLADLLRLALARVDLVVLTGGLGPTDDDVTRAAVADVLQRRLVERADILARIEARFARRNMPMPAINRRQAQVVEGATVLENAQGTAPGQWIEVGHHVVLMLPGPPRELRPMVDGVVMDRLRSRVAGHRLVKRSIRIVGPTESHAEERLQPLYGEWAQRPLPVAATILAARGQIELQLTVRSDDAEAAAAALDRAVDEVHARFGAEVCSRDGIALEARIGELLRARGWRLALAESCTGGLATSRLVDVAGSSDYVDRAFVVYSNQAKIDELGVDPELLAAHGAVSEPVARAMAEGARRASGADIALAITGVAGPGGGTPEKPVGTVVIAVSDRNGRDTVQRLLLPGDRSHIRWFASTLALDAVRRVLIDA